VQDLRITFVGAGSRRYAIPVIAQFAQFFGERPLEIMLHDTDQERLDLMDRVARTLFTSDNAHHRLVASVDPKEALDGAAGVISAIGANYGRKLFALPFADFGLPEDREVLRQKAFDHVSELVPSEAKSSILIDRNGSLSLDLVAPLAGQERDHAPHLAMRVVRADLYGFELYRLLAPSRLSNWLGEVIEANR